MKLKPLQKYFFFLIVAIASCRETTTIKRPDVSNINVQVHIERFDQDLAQINPEDIGSMNKAWQERYGIFYSNYMQDILQIANPADSIRVKEFLTQIIKQKDFVDLNKAVAKVYPSMESYEKELTQVFKYVKYYFPEYNIPRFITYVSGFAYQTPIGEDYVGIGLDMFLGAESEFYPALVQSIPLYISRRFTPENIVPRVIEAVLREDIYSIPDQTHNTLQHMIYNGKIMYAMDMLLENVSDELKIGYTKEHLAWANKYQSDVWTWFLQENLLYSTDHLRTQKYFTEAPFTPELGEKNESAPKLGSFIGWMMVRKYMERHPETSLKELFAIEDAQKILEGSKYKGK
ncbi:gliding motility lipoprotein GldB [Sphingobacterium sp. SGL-16]|uniref:gliding motility lipoprotein GldB n=1 Tax=Sphingobacterium sp. SGL-16 TaxID=2710883 RepID=UPI0013EC2AA1|nr:gliding motility lipoprotein GldB [Sphingobacterium sp. SGL-16]NGM73411.1 gliding motility lipoprotein GldB [Sphingobacterium sp. SGL-16]